MNPKQSQSSDSPMSSCLSLSPNGVQDAERWLQANLAHSTIALSETQLGWLLANKGANAHTHTHTDTNTTHPHSTIIGHVFLAPPSCQLSWRVLDNISLVSVLACAPWPLAITAE